MGAWPRWAVAAVLALVATAMSGCATVVAGTPAPRAADVETTISTDDPHVVRRTGYPDPAVGVGDPGGLLAGPSRPVTMRGGVPVVPACALLMLRDLAALGLQPNSTSPVAVGQTRLADGNAVDRENDEAFNSCHYWLRATDDHRRSVRIAVHQPSYTDPGAMALRLIGYDSSEFRGEVLVRKDYGSRVRDPAYWLEHRGVAVELDTELWDDAKARAVLDLVARRLVEVVARPSGPATFTYRSPLFSGVHVNACDVSRWSDLGSLVGHDVPPAFSTEIVANGVGVFALLRDERANYIQSSCHYSEGQKTADSVDRAQLAVETYTFDAVEDARDYVTIERDYVGTVETTPRAGDESISIPTAFGDGSRIVARKGRVILCLDYRPSLRVGSAAGEGHGEAVAAAVALDRVGS
jgi:hypothetical protein